MDDLTPAVREREAAALKRLFESRPERLSQAEFARRFEIGSAGMVWQYLNAHRPLNLAVATKFAHGLGVKIDDFSPRLAAAARAVSAATAPHEDEGQSSLVDQAINSLDPYERREALAYLQFKVERAGAHGISEKLARYISGTGDPADPAGKDQGARKPRH